MRVEAVFTPSCKHLFKKDCRYSSCNGIQRITFMEYEGDYDEEISMKPVMDKNNGIRRLLVNAIVELCQRETFYAEELRIEGTVCVVSDRSSVVIAQITEHVGDTMMSGHDDTILTSSMENITADVQSSTDKLHTKVVTPSHVPAKEGHPCPFCSQSFHREKSLYQHIITHTGQKTGIKSDSDCYTGGEYAGGDWSQHIAIDGTSTETERRKHKRGTMHRESLMKVKQECVGTEDEWQSTYDQGNTTQIKDCINRHTYDYRQNDSSRVDTLYGDEFVQKKGHFSEGDTDGFAITEPACLSESTSSSFSKQPDDVHGSSFAEQSIAQQLNEAGDVKQTIEAIANQYTPQGSQTFSSFTTPEKSHVSADQWPTDGSADVSYQGDTGWFTETPGTGSSRYSCRLCGRTFKQRGSLREHADSHLGRRLHVCRVCGCTFTYRSSLHNHMRSKHSAPPNATTLRHSCATCSRRFRYRSELDRHLRCKSGHQPAIAHCKPEPTDNVEPTNPDVSCPMTISPNTEFDQTNVIAQPSADVDKIT